MSISVSITDSAVVFKNYSDDGQGRCLEGEDYLGLEELSAALLPFLNISHPALIAENKALREALEFYAKPEIYEPHPHGPAFDRRDLSYRAKAALSLPKGGS